MALRKIKLYGKLGQLFGREWNLDINSVAEAIKAIDINTNNKFSQYLLKNGTKKYYKVCVKNKKNLISKDEINTSFGSGDIYITPTISGSGKNGTWQVIAGVILVAVSYYYGGFGPNASFFASTAGNMGIALILGGVAQMLAPNPNAESTDQRNSYLFQGNATTVYQGTSVGIIYGRALVPPMPVCISTDSLDEENYEGEIVNLGKVGLLDETLIFYSSKSGTATLCGYSEYTDPSIPPKTYRLLTTNGSADYTCSTGGSATRTRTGTVTIDKDTCIQTSTGSPSYNAPCLCICDDLIETKTVSQMFFAGSYVSIGGCCGSETYMGLNGSSQSELTIEDTELDAIVRLLNSTAWSAWQSSPISPYYQSRTTGFSFFYKIVKTKSITLPSKYNPGFSYKYSIILQRRIYSSSDEWVDAEIMETIVTPQSDGTLILPEIELNNISGYETRVKSTSLNYN